MKQPSTFTSARELVLNNLDQWKTRPWLSCELQVSLHFSELETSKEYNLFGESEIHKYTASVDEESSQALNKHGLTAILKGISMPSLGIEFVPNSAMIGTPIPKVNNGVLGLSMALPIASHSGGLTVDSQQTLASRYLGSYGTLYEDQFTQGGMLRLRSNKSKPFIIVKLVASDIRDVSGNPFVLPLYELQYCRFSMPVPSSGNAGSSDAMEFAVKVAFEDYKILPHEVNFINNNKVTEAAVLAKTTLEKDIATGLMTAAGAALGITL